MTSTEVELLTSLEVSNLPPKTKKVYNIIHRLATNGMIHAGNGWCVSMSDLIQTYLETAGIRSHMLEVDLRINNENGTAFIGLEDKNKRLDTYDTHVVVIADCETPILIDASISKYLPFGKLAVFEPIVERGNNYFFTFKDHSLDLTYRTKSLQTVPLTHQSSIIQRIKTDNDVQRQLNFLKVIVFAAALFSILNSAINLNNYYETYIEKNAWGPQSQKELIEKVDKLYEKIIIQENK